MGQEILYCAVCRTQLRRADFEKKQALRAGGEAYCAGCLPAGLQPDSEEPVAGTPRRGIAAVGRKLTPSSTRTPAVKESHDKPTRRWTVPQGRKSNTGLIVGGVAGGLVLLIILLAAAGSSGPNHARAPKPPPVEPAPSPPPAKPRPAPIRSDPEPNLPRERTALRALQKARKLSNDEPDNLEGQLALYDEAIKAAEGTLQYGDAKKERGAVRSRMVSARAQALIALDKEADQAFRNGEFKRLFSMLEAAKGKRSDPGRQGEIESRRRVYERRIDEQFESVRKKAEKARREGKEDEVKGFVETVARWEIRKYGDELSKALAAVKPPKPPADPEVDRYRSEWARAMAQAASGDIAAANAVLVEAAKAVQEAGLKKESERDLELLGRALSLAVTLDAAPRGWKKGKKVRFDYLDAAGTVRSVEGTVAGVKNGLLSLEGRAGRIELGEIRSASLAAEAEDRTAAALLYLIAGKASAARTAAGKEWEELPEKYRTYTGSATAVSLTPGEAAARRLYYASLDQLLGSATAAEGLAGLQSLLENHADTGFVKRNLEAIEHTHKEGGREFLFPADALNASGSFTRDGTEEHPSIWLSSSDSRLSDRLKNFVEFEFSASPGTRYRAWFFVGGCCGETLTFFAQGTELKTRRGGPAAEPGSDELASVRQRVRTSPRKHVDHGGPKHPERWGWVEIFLPAYRTVGLKKLRLVSDQKGFGVEYGFLSASARIPPRGDALKELAEIRRTARVGAPVIGGLVAHWKFDENTGAVVADSAGSGVEGRIGKGATWSPGKKIGGVEKPALRFDGKDGHVALGKNLSLLRNVRGCTLAAWIQADTISKTERNSIITFSIHNEGAPTSLSRAAIFLTQDDEVAVAARTKDKDEVQIVTTTTSPVKPGTWAHVAAVIDYSGNRIAVYVNGQPQAISGTVTFSTPEIPDTPSAIAAIGADDDGDGGFFDGRILDVRVYNRALSATEVASLLGGGGTVRAPAGGLVALYRFEAGTGDVVRDVSGSGSPLDLKIADPSAVAWLAGRGLQIKGTTLITPAGPPTKIFDACRRTKALTVEAWVRPSSDDQRGPARIVTLSKDGSYRAFTMGQGALKGPNRMFIMRVHSSGALRNGMPEFQTKQGTVSTRLTHLVYTRAADGQERYYIDGSEAARGVRKGDFSPWKKEYRFALANEHSRDRAWLGEYRLVAIYSRALTADEVGRNFSAGP